MKHLLLTTIAAVTVSGFTEDLNTENRQTVDLKHIEKQFQDSGLPAAYMVGLNLKTNKRIALAFNYSADGNDIFRIASMTKILTAVAALQLVEQGKIKLDEPLNKILPEMAEVPIIGKGGKLYSSDAPISLRQLLTHTAGFAYGFTSKSLENYLKNTKGEAPNKHPKRARVSEPGEKYCYGTSLDWTGKLIEKISDKSLEQYFRDHIAGPLKMDATWFNPPVKLHERIVDYHVRAGEEFTQAGQRVPKKTTFHNGGGGLVSSANDYLRLLTCLFNAGELEGVRILKRRTVRLMFKDQLPKNLSVGFPDGPAQHAWVTDGGFDRDFRNDRWGFSWGLEGDNPDGLRSKGAAFWAGIFNSYFTLDRKQGVIVVYYSQFLPFSDHDAYGLYRAFEKEVYLQTK
jgi:CubicO group peptidase (beta-lactamase class C family)